MGPELKAAIKVGSTVMRGKDWEKGWNEDRRGLGTVTELYSNKVYVQWDTGYGGVYRLGWRDYYDIKYV